MTTENNAAGQKREWDYHPELPLQNPSIFRRPMSPVLLLRWFYKNWLTLSERVLLVLLAVIMWYFFYPELARAVDFSPGWMLQVYAINFVLMLVIAGSLHGYFYVYRGQEDRLKFDHRGMAKGKLWDFSSQVKDNMFWSLGSGVLQLSAYQIVSMWLMANGYVPILSFADNPIWFLLLFVLVPVWSAFHFYWVHRLLHYPWLYKRVHSLHHRNISIGPWSGLSMHPVEHLLYLSSLCIHWVLASHPIHLYYHVLFVGPGAAMTHTGYEDLLIRDKRTLALGTFYHQLHHRFFNCNYGNQELPMDRWFGTFHNGTTDATAAMRQRSLRR